MCGQISLSPVVAIRPPVLSNTFLETSLLILREPREDEARYFYELDQDPEVMRYLSDGRPTSVVEANVAMGRVQKILRAHTGRLGLWWALRKDSGEFLGWFHFRPDKSTPDDVRNIELGYRLKQKFWRKGFATEVSRVLIEFGFRGYGLDSVFAVTMKSNVASRGVMEKVGLRFVSEYLYESFLGPEKMAVRYELKRGAWEKNQNCQKSDI